MIDIGKKLLFTNEERERKRKHFYRRIGDGLKNIGEKAGREIKKNIESKRKEAKRQKGIFDKAYRRELDKEIKKKAKLKAKQKFKRKNWWEY